MKKIHLAEKRKNVYARRFVLGGGALIGMLLASVCVASLQVTAAPPPPLPPVPTATVIPAPTASSAPSAPSVPFAGAFIKLYIQFSQDWPWDEMQWQDLFTVVQWQDVEGQWHDVDGWRGGLDSVAVATEDIVMGHKTWWLAEENFGTGPFRWQVYQGQKGRLLTTSGPFNLPAKAKSTLVIEVVLTP